MRKISILLFIVFCISSAAAKPLRDGAVLAGADGTLVKDPNGQSWFFVFKTAVSDNKGEIKKGDAAELLRSSTLEKMIEVTASNKSDFRLWGHVTQFEGKNFIFPVYFLTITEQIQQDINEPSEKQTISINDPNDVVNIPEEILKKLKPEHTVDLAQISPTSGLEEDRMFSDRSGFITKTPADQYVFKPDALGRNLQKDFFVVLPNEIVKRAIDEQSKSADRLRYKISGILTAYNGKNYILLQRAIRQYSHGNFAR